MNIYVDIDETICQGGSPHDYSLAEPKYDIIEKINLLYDLGHTVTYWTARGGISGIDWRDLTERQLSIWGAKYNFLRMDKPVFDLFIDDKVMTSDKDLPLKLDYILEKNEYKFAK